MERPIIIRPRAVWRGDHSSEKFNLYANQFLMEMRRIADILNQQAAALSDDIKKISDDSNPYPDNPYHPFSADDEGKITLPIFDKSLEETVPYNFISTHKINSEYQSAKEKALSILRGLS
jgi:hypothetical protein